MSRSRASVKTEEKKIKDIKEIIGEAPEPVKEKPESEKVLTMKVLVDHDGVEYKPGDVVPEKFTRLFRDKGFAEFI